MVRKLTTIPCSRARSWRTTSALPAKPRRKPVLEPVKPPASPRLSLRNPPAHVEVPLHRRAAAAQFTRNPLSPPAHFMQPDHCRYLVRQQHALSLSLSLSLSPQ